jgi:hypothetical protein
MSSSIQVPSTAKNSPEFQVPLEVRVPDRQHLVDEQDLAVEVGGDGEAQPHLHAARVVLDLTVDGVLDLGELDDRIEALRHLTPG